MTEKSPIKYLNASDIEKWNAWNRRSNARLDLRSSVLENRRLPYVTLNKCDLSRMTNYDYGFRLDGPRSSFDGSLMENASFDWVDLTEASFRGSEMQKSRFQFAGLHSTDFSKANLRNCRFISSNLTSAVFSGADLTGSEISGCTLFDSRFDGANLSGVLFQNTFFANVDLSKAVGLDSCRYAGPSIVDFRTLQRSGVLPLSFLRGIGLPESLINYLPSLMEQAIQTYSCFISFSAKNQDFADRLYADLQNNGIRCWFAPLDLRIGEDILHGIDQAIRVREKVVLILSEESIASGWVQDEVTTAFEEERKRKETVLFPIRIDDAVMDAAEPWAAKLRARNIGDFRGWKDHDTYKKAFARVLRDLTKQT
jgi:uncharacterized protein YjbI with pentapeptide repeats